MKIKVREEKKSMLVNFKDLNVGDCYLDSEGDLCMKIASIFSECETEYNCVCLNNGYITYDWGEVTPVEVTSQYYEK